LFEDERRRPAMAAEPEDHPDVQVFDEIRYIDLAGPGAKNKRRRYIDAFVTEFIERRTRRDVKCPSTPTKTARSTITTSNTVVTGFMAALEKRTSERLKR